MEERRNDVEIRLIAQELKSLNTSFEKSENIAQEWRAAFCKKLDIVSSKLDAIPCKEQEERMKGIRSDVSWLQKIGSWALALIITSLFTLGVGWGNISTVVDANSIKWAKLEPEFKQMGTNIEVLKEKSYGYRGIKVVTDGMSKTDRMS